MTIPHVPMLDAKVMAWTFIATAFGALFTLIVGLEIAEYKEERRIMAMRKARRW